MSAVSIGCYLYQVMFTCILEGTLLNPFLLMFCNLQPRLSCLVDFLRVSSWKTPNPNKKLKQNQSKATCTKKRATLGTR